MSSFSSEAFINTDTRRFKIHTSNMESLPPPPLPIPGRASYNASFSFDLLSRLRNQVIFGPFVISLPSLDTP